MYCPSSVLRWTVSAACCPPGSRHTLRSRYAQEAARRSISAAGLPAAIERQAAAAVDEADALIFVVDGQARPRLARLAAVPTPCHVPAPCAGFGRPATWACLFGTREAGLCVLFLGPPCRLAARLWTKKSWPGCAAHTPTSQVGWRARPAPSCASACRATARQPCLTGQGPAPGPLTLQQQCAHVLPARSGACCEQVRERGQGGPDGC